MSRCSGWAVAFRYEPGGRLGRHDGIKHINSNEYTNTLQQQHTHEHVYYFFMIFLLECQVRRCCYRPLMHSCRTYRLPRQTCIFSAILKAKNCKGISSSS